MSIDPNDHRTVIECLGNALWTVYRRIGDGGKSVYCSRCLARWSMAESADNRMPALVNAQRHEAWCPLSLVRQAEGARPGE